MLDLGLKHFDTITLPDTIVGEKITIARRTHAHDEALFALIDGSRDFLGEYLFWVDDTKTVQDVQVVTDIFDANWEAHKGFECVFIDTLTGTVVGAGGIHTIDYMNRWAEWGYYLDKNATGKGYITEVVRLMEQELFSRGIHRLVISCDTANIASAAVAKRCGYEQEGILRECKLARGTWRDNYIFAKLNTRAE